MRSRFTKAEIETLKAAVNGYGKSIANLRKHTKVAHRTSHLIVEKLEADGLIIKQRVNGREVKIIPTEKAINLIKERDYHVSGRDESMEYGMKIDNKLGNWLREYARSKRMRLNSTIESIIKEKMAQVEKEKLNEGNSLFSGKPIK
jgi:DNA-binding MarR family transcriptional regulator